MIAEVIARLKSMVPDFGGRVDGAMELTDLMQRNALPPVTPAAHVLPLGLQGGEPSVANAFFVQMTTEVVGVVITLRTYSQTGASGIDPIEALRALVISALCGWAPDGVPGVFRLMRATLVSMNAGTAAYQIEFAIFDQLRIAP